MKSFIILIFISITSLCQVVWSQTSEIRIEIDRNSLTINDRVINAPINVSSINELIGERGKIIFHKEKTFTDDQHGTTHTIGKFVEVIYEKSGLVFSGRDIEKLTHLKIHFLNKKENNLLMNSLLEQEFENKKDQPYFNLSKRKYMRSYSKIDIGNLGPLPNKSYSGALIFNDILINPDTSLINLDKEVYEYKIKGRLGSYNPFNFNKILFSQNFECFIPSPSLIRGFCGCSARGIQLILTEDNMKLHSLEVFIGII